MIVADTNLIAYALITGTESEKARQVLMKDQNWSAPRLWRSEFMNILALYMRRRQFDLVVAVELFQGAERLLQENEYEVDCSRVLQLTESSSCSAYDCQFVALAMELKVALVTSDREILNEFPGVALAPEKFLSD